jgi:hypothetical protein
MLLLLVSLWTGAYALDTTLTVDLNDDEARNKEFRRATPVCHVKFILPTGYTLRPQPGLTLPCSEGSCTVARNDGAKLNVVGLKDDSTERFTFNITFDPNRKIGCSNYLPNMKFVRGTGSMPILCDPVFSCNYSSNDSATSVDSSSVRWWRFANASDLKTFLNSSSAEKSGLQIVDANNTEPLREANNTLFVSLGAGVFDVLGYFATTFDLDGEELVNGDTFIIYLNPEGGQSPGDQELIFGERETRNFDKIFCSFTSFPYSTVRWEGPGSNFTTQDTGTALVLEEVEGDERMSDLTLEGRLVITEVQYEDGVEITCIATHSISGAEESITVRLRVRDPLRPLWPFLGLLGSLIITFLFISGGALVDKIRGKQGVDDDDGKAVRLLVFGGSATRPACLPASVVLHLLHASSSSF